ncbi:O-antigen/teichoic acid export membrane protein [Paraburkholderia tropica]|uniref:lipopolysaccharide biosynthesis protein n=1 Tax=Paraburkholderia tropica TaxID=92647 RepID=UPI0016169119|nr:translocase [Paraburkholderia tropica]MBB3003262.1 O-antigen/teichoic acid export membrane protein [Paraburkholderia tropica]MBB6322278.1 O-antigen/teichoic acid export membrane protein [Paraburkholderia tropica]
MIRARDSIVSLGGVLGGQLVFFLCVALIGREGGPDVLGKFNTSVAVGMFAGTLLALRFELACVDDDPVRAFGSYLHVLALGFSMFVVLEVMTVLCGYATYLSLGIFALGYFIQQASNFYLNSLRRYGLISLYRIAVNLAFLLLLLAHFQLGFLNDTSPFTIYTAINLVAAIATAAMIAAQGNRQSRSFAFSPLFFVTNRRFAKFILPSTLCGSVLTYSLTIVFPLWFDATNAGYFAAAYRFGFFPVSLIGQSLGGVFRRDSLSAATHRDATASLKSVYVTYARALAALSLIYAAGSLLLFPFFVDILFGRQWSITVTFFRCLVPLFALQILYIPLSQVFLVLKAQRTDFLFQLLTAAVLLVALATAKTAVLSAQQSVLTFALAGSGVMLIGIALTARAVRNQSPAISRTGQPDLSQT